MTEQGLKKDIFKVLNNGIFKVDKILDQKEFKNKNNPLLNVKNIIHNDIITFIKDLPFEINEIPKNELILFTNSEVKEFINTFFKYLDSKFLGVNSKDIFKKEIKNESFDWSSSLKNKQIRCIKKLLVFKYTKLYTVLRDTYGEELTRRNQYFICPYCKRNYINVVVSDDGVKSVKPDLDHFYPKSIYPFLAVTLSNLIPSCLTCNQRCKGSIDTFEKTPHIFPPENVFKLLKFTHNFEPKKINIEIENNYAKFNTSKEEVENHLETFLIQETYGSHTEIIDLIKEKFDKYTESKIEDLSSCIKGLKNTVIRNIVFYEYERMKKENNKEPLYKLKIDLYDDIVK